MPKFLDGIQWYNEQGELTYALSPLDLAFSTASWKTIKWLSTNGVIKNFYNIGDEKIITLTNGKSLKCTILGFNHDETPNGDKLGATFGAITAFNGGKYPMNETNSNSGGFTSSSFKNSTMTTILQLMPQDLKDKMAIVKKSAAMNVDFSSSFTSKIWPFAEVEIDGTSEAPYKDEGKQYEYWKTVKDGTISADRIIQIYPGGGAGQNWWLRSSDIQTGSKYKYISDTGEIKSANATSDFYFIFGFCM